MNFINVLMKPVVAYSAALLLFSNAFAEPTLWKPTGKSLTQLLDDGWRVVSMNDFQWFEDANIDRTFSASVPTGRVFSFLLEKSGKNIVCLLVSPKPNDATSNCRQLN